MTLEEAIRIIENRQKNAQELRKANAQSRSEHGESIWYAKAQVYEEVLGLLKNVDETEKTDMVGG